MQTVYLAQSLVGGNRALSNVDRKPLLSAKMKMRGLRRGRAKRELRDRAGGCKEAKVEHHAQCLGLGLAMGLLQCYMQMWPGLQGMHIEGLCLSAWRIGHRIVRNILTEITKLCHHGGGPLRRSELRRAFIACSRPTRCL